jgi:hypothetical protein
MNILKTNGRIASKKIHLLADTIMETSIQAAWSLTNDQKKQLILKSDWHETDLEILNAEEDTELNHRTAFVFAMETWTTGYYCDFPVKMETVAKYFIGWGRFM